MIKVFLVHQVFKYGIIVSILTTNVEHYPLNYPLKVYKSSDVIMTCFVATLQWVRRGIVGVTVPICDRLTQTVTWVHHVRLADRTQL